MESPFVGRQQSPGHRVFCIEGEVSHGESFEQPFGDSLLFRLSPASHAANPQGWTIEVRSARDPQHDFVAVATPPYRFFNPRDLTTSYGFTAREIVQMSPRHFRFVLDEPDRARFAAALERLLWPADRTPEELKRAEEEMSRIHTGEGVFKIVDFSLQEADEEHRLGLIESLRFRVRLCTDCPDANATEDSATRSGGSRG